MIREVAGLSRGVVDVNSGVGGLSREVCPTAAVSSPSAATPAAAIAAGTAAAIAETATATPAHGVQAPLEAEHEVAAQHFRARVAHGEVRNVATHVAALMQEVVYLQRDQPFSREEAAAELHVPYGYILLDAGGVAVAAVEVDAR